MIDDNADRLMDWGGPVFPVTAQGTGGWPVVFHGMTLRDWFAGRAMQVYLVNPLPEATYDNIAEKAYRMADAMLRERDMA